MLWHPVPVLSPKSEWTAEVTLYQWIVSEHPRLATSLLLIMSVPACTRVRAVACPTCSAAACPAAGGSSVVERNLDRISVVLSVIWISCIVSLALLYKHNV